MTEIIFSSSYDDKFPAENVLSSGKDFWTSTGLYPQELLLQLESTKTLTSINLVSYGIKNIVIESCENESAITFVKQAEMIDVPYTEGKLQEFFLNFKSVNSKTKILKVAIEAGYENFCFIHNISFK